MHNDKPPAIPNDIGTITNPLPVTDVDVAPMITYCQLILKLCLDFYSFHIPFPI